MKMQLLYLLNGRAESIIKANSYGNDDMEVIKIDEKDLTDFKRIVSYVKNGNYKSLYFGCIELELQRFHFFMMLFIFLTTRSGGIIDGSGNSRKFSVPSFLLKYLPLFVIELLISGIVVIYNYIKLPFVIMKWIRAR